MKQIQQFFLGVLVSGIFWCPASFGDLMAKNAPMSEEIIAQNSPKPPQIQEFIPEPDINDIIEKYAEIHDVALDLAIDLAKYESNLNPEAKNPNSSALGLYQFLKDSWVAYDCEGERADPEDNANCALREIGKGNISPWTADINTQRFLVQNNYVGCWNFSKNECFLK